MQAAAVRAEPCLGLFFMGRQRVDQTVEIRAVVSLNHMRDFVGGDEIEYEIGRHHQTPGIIQRAVVRT